MKYFWGLCIVLMGFPWLPWVVTAENYFAVYANRGTFEMHSAGADDSSEVEAYIDTIPKRPLWGGGGGFFIDSNFNAMGLDGAGIGFSQLYGEVLINKKLDPDNTASNVFVKKAKRKASGVVVYLKTIEFFTFGLGTESGNIDFEIERGGEEETERFSFSYPYIHLSASTAALTGRSGFYLAVVAQTVDTLFRGGKLGNFSGTSFAVAIGIMW